MPDGPQDDPAPTAAATGEEGTRTPADIVAHIGAVSQNARTTWFGLLGLLAFMGVTLLSHSDADFFARGAETDLPLIGISIPVYGFFITAPLLVAAVYTYLHLYLVTLWSALAEAPERVAGTPLSEAIYPWLLSRAGLWWRSRLRRVPGADGRPRADRSTQRYAMGATSMAVSVLITWVAAPLVLGLFWVRSWPVHDPRLSLALGAILLWTLWVGLRSWSAMRRLMRGGHRRAHATPWWLWPLAAGALGLLIHLTVARSSGSLDELRRQTGWAGQWADAADWAARWQALSWQPLPDRLRGLADAMPGAVPPHLPDWEGWRQAQGIAYDRATDWDDVRDRWRGHLDASFGGGATGLDIARLQERELVARPRDLPGYAAWWDGFRKDWLAEHPPAPDAPPPEHTQAFWAAAKTGWARALASLRGPALQRADLRHADLDGARLPRADLRGARLEHATLAGTVLHAADLSPAYPDDTPRPTALLRANLGGAQMQGADLRGAQMQGATLPEAQMQGAVLREARMQGAVLRRAQMQGAVLREAEMQGADLRWARMQGAYLFEAQMQGAFLNRAQMQGAVLRRARMQGAYLNGAQMQGADLGLAEMQGADLRGAQMQGADLRGARMQGANLRGAQMAFADCAEAVLSGAPAQAANLTCKGLTAQQLAGVIGDARTLLPRGLAVASCWANPPETLDQTLALYSKYEREARRADWLCPEGQAPRPTGRWRADPKWDGGAFFDPDRLWIGLGYNAGWYVPVTAAGLAEAAARQPRD